MAKSQTNDMKRIGLLSDTHNWWDERFEKYFATCDEIWHAGDIGSIELADKFARLKPFRAVYGNIDDQIVRSVYPEIIRFEIENIEVLMTHIGGYPGKYNPKIKTILESKPPQLFICGHSHILKVMYDKKLKCLHINPGAAGVYGFHAVRTLVCFTIDKKEIKDLEVIELKDL